MQKNLLQTWRSVSLVTDIFSKIENYFTFKSQLAVKRDLSAFNLLSDFIESAGTRIAVRYKITDSPHFILFSHGNGSTIEGIQHIYSFYDELKVSYLAYDYPGYGNSSGSPSEHGCYLAFNLAYDYVLNKLKINPNKIVCHGLSLGGAVTIHAVRGKPVQKIILEATFTSGADMARYKFPYLPFIGKIAKQFDSISKIQDLTAQVLFIHGDDDEVVPLSQGQKLYEKCSGKKTFYVIPGCGHSGHAAFAGAAYLKIWQNFLGTASS